MGRQDPGAANGGAYPQAEARCVCSHRAAFHAYGRREGREVRTACSASRCECSRYAADPQAQPERCPTCGSAIEAARRTQ